MSTEWPEKWLAWQRSWLAASNHINRVGPVNHQRVTRSSLRGFSQFVYYEDVSESIVLIYVLNQVLHLLWWYSSCKGHRTCLLVGQISFLPWSSPWKRFSIHVLDNAYLCVKPNSISFAHIPGTWNVIIICEFSIISQSFTLAPDWEFYL